MDEDEDDFASDGTAAPPQQIGLYGEELQLESGHPDRAKFHRCCFADDDEVQFFNIKVCMLLYSFRWNEWIWGLIPQIPRAHVCPVDKAASTVDAMACPLTNVFVLRVLYGFYTYIYKYLYIYIYIFSFPHIYYRRLILPSLMGCKRRCLALLQSQAAIPLSKPCCALLRDAESAPSASHTGTYLSHTINCQRTRSHIACC